MYRIALFAAAAVAIPAAAFSQAAPAPAPTTAAPATAAPGAAAPAAGAPAAGKPAVGATVYDSAGVSIGTIESMEGGNATINTGSAKITLNASGIGSGPNGPMIAMTKAQLDAAASAKAGESAAAFQAKLTPGAQVYGKGGTMLGTIKVADAQNVTLTTPKGDVKIPVNGFGPGDKGIMLNMTDAELAAAMKPAKK